MRIAFDNTAQIPGTAQTKKVVFYNSGLNTIYWGFESTTSASGDTQGVALIVGAEVIIDGNPCVQAPIYLAAASGAPCIINYTQMT